MTEIELDNTLTLRSKPEIVDLPSEPYWTIAHPASFRERNRIKKRAKAHGMSAGNFVIKTALLMDLIADLEACRPGYKPENLPDGLVKGDTFKPLVEAILKRGYQSYLEYKDDPWEADHDEEGTENHVKRLLTELFRLSANFNSDMRWWTDSESIRKDP